MNLGTIFLVSILCVQSGLPVAARDQTAPPSTPANTAEAPGQDTSQSSPSTPQTPPAAPDKTSSRPSPAKTTKRRPKKKAVSSNCGNVPAAPANSGSGNTAPSPTAGTPANCPPSKVIVQQGGTADKSIQLAGATPGTSANQKDTANQMLAATESNLKKISGQQLNSSQQEMVSQIRQFMAQSKAAVGDGDMERARTLAWKAQVLSEELVKPAE
ncbi:MAG TPA: hypothetical protein VFL34_09835 [Candidatus Sulfotelmatobacter sp.]|nr:hypothetical protein [Candidatus Sulfotelmatobacter sp.]